MNLMDVFRMAMGALSANVVRSLLTILAIVVGVFAVISSSTAVGVLDRYFKETLTLLGGSVIQVSRYPGVQMGDMSAYRNRKPITFEIMEQLKERSVMSRFVSPEATFAWTRIEFQGERTNPNVSVYGGNEYWLLNNAYEIANGRDISPEDVIHARPVALIGEEVRKRLFGEANSVGKVIRIDGQWYTIIGEVKSKGSAFGQSLDRYVTIPYTRLAQVYGTTDLPIIFQVQAPAFTLINETMDEITSQMRIIRGVAPGEPNDFELTTNDSLRGSFDSFTGILYLFGWIVGGVALLGAGIGVMNIMLVSVTERTREIGIRKSVGATRRAIVQQFLLETIVICQIGGILGIVVGIAGGNILALTMDSPMVVPWGSVIGGVVAMTVIGLLFGVYPAMKAARLDPITSLRYE
jgi:putative ABC transport system permease protein